MLKNNYVAHIFSLKVPVGDIYIEDVNVFLSFLAKARKFNNKIMLYP